MKIEKIENSYSLRNLTIEEFTAIITALGDYCEKRGTDTTGYNMLYSYANTLEQCGSKELAKIIRSMLPMKVE